MNYKIWLIGIVIMLIIASSSLAIQETGLELYFPMNQSGTDLPVDYAGSYDNSLTVVGTFANNYKYVTIQGYSMLNVSATDTSGLTTGTDTGLTLASGESYSVCFLSYVYNKTPSANEYVVRLGTADNFGVARTTAGDWHMLIGGNFKAFHYSQNAFTLEHICMTFNNSVNTVKTYVNASYKGQDTGASDDISFTNTGLNIGHRDFGNFFKGAIGQLRVWYGTVLTQDEVTAVYELDTGATSEESSSEQQIDLDIMNVVYDLPFNYSNKNKLVENINMPINFTIYNNGTNNTYANYNLTIDNVELCSANVSFVNKTNTTISCNWTSELGFYNLNLSVDYQNNVNETDETNNEYVFTLPFMNRPYAIPEYTQDYEDFIKNSSNKVAYYSWNFYKTFDSDNWNPTWTTYSVDPRAKKGREWATRLYINNYADAEALNESRLALFGWLNMTGWNDADVQSTHDLIHVVYIFDILFPILNQTDLDTLRPQIANVCKELAYDNNIQPYTDSANTPTWDNGKGFGTGFQAVCDYANGLDPNNPTMMIKEYTMESPSLAFDKRLNNFLAGFNSTNAISPEGTLYKWYSQYHLADMLQLKKGMNDTSLINGYQTALNSMAQENIYVLLDHSYNGNTLRNDENNIWRSISKGDSNSYENVGSDGLAGWGHLTQIALLSDNQTIKNALFNLRNKGFDTAEQTRSFPELIDYYKLYEQINNSYDINDFQKVFYDELNDRLTLRTNYSYENDTVIIWSANQDRSYGHSDGYSTNDFIYSNGEPFFDYMQVPYNDNVRTEVFSNGISFTQNTTSGYSQTCGNAILNLYYGMSDCVLDALLKFPIQYSGDLTLINYDSDGKKAVALRTTPMKDATYDTKEYKLLFNNIYAQYKIVYDSPTNYIYDNSWNILEEFDADNNGTSVLFTRTSNSKQARQTIPYANESFTFTTENSTIQYGFTKTNAPTGKGYYQHTYMNISSPSAEWFNLKLFDENVNATVKNIGINDKGLLIGENTLIFFDTNKDGIINESGIYTDALAIAYNNATNISITGNSTFLYINNVLTNETTPPVNDSEPPVDNETTPFIPTTTAEVCNDAQDFNLTVKAGIIVTSLLGLIALIKILSIIVLMVRVKGDSFTKDYEMKKLSGFFYGLVVIYFLIGIFMIGGTYFIRVLCTGA